MSDEYQVKYPTNVESKIAGRFVAKILVLVIGVIVALVTYCCRRLRRNTGTVQSQPVVRQSNYNASRFPPIPLPPPPTSVPPPPTSVPPPPTSVPSPAPSAPDANVLPPSYDQVCANQPPYYKAAH